MSTAMVLYTKEEKKEKDKDLERVKKRQQSLDRRLTALEQNVRVIQRRLK